MRTIRAYRNDGAEDIELLRISEDDISRDYDERYFMLKEHEVTELFAYILAGYEILDDCGNALIPYYYSPTAVQAFFA